MKADALVEGLIAQSLSPQMLGIFGAAFSILILATVAKVALRRRRGSRSNRNRPGNRGMRGAAEPTITGPAKTGIHDPAVQLEAISHVDFETQPLLNAEEEPVLGLLEAEANALGAGFRVMAQTSLGEIVRPKQQGADADQRQQAFRAINSKRLDFAVFNKFGKLVLALEYQGSGHYRRTSFMRDAVKREVLRKAGVVLIEAEAGYDPSEISAKVRRVLEDHLVKIGHRPVSERSGPTVIGVAGRLTADPLAAPGA